MGWVCWREINKIRTLHKLLAFSNKKPQQIDCMNHKRTNRPSKKTVPHNPGDPSLGFITSMIDFDKVNRHIDGLIEMLSIDQRLLQQTGLQALRKHMGEMSAQYAPHQGASFDKLCQYMAENLGERYTMANLEKISGLSARSLQYRFKLRFNCTPMRWLTQQRLKACHHRFLHPLENDTVTSVALYYGFANLGNFARLYAQQIGELPSESLRKSGSA